MSKHKEENAGTSAPEKRRGSSRLFWIGSRLLVVAILLAVLAFFAQLLLTSTGAWRSLLASAAPELAALLKIEGLEVSWLAPLEVRGIAVADPSGQPLA